MAVINGMGRWATEGFRVQRHNGDGTIPTPQRFLGFANTVDLSGMIGAPRKISVKIDDRPAVEAQVEFAGVSNPSRVTVAEAAAALNAAGIPDVTFGADPYTGRLCGKYSTGRAAELTVEIENGGLDDHVIPAGTYGLTFGGRSFASVQPEPVPIGAGESAELAFVAVADGAQPSLPGIGDPVDMTSLVPHLSTDFVGRFVGAIQGADDASNALIVQIYGPLAAALDFGQSLRHGGDGLRVLSFFSDETINIGLPKDVNEKEEIDIESAKGAVRRLVIGASLFGMSPLFVLNQKNYHFLELAQGGRLDRETGEYEPPLPNESEHPSFWGEIFSPVYGDGTHNQGNVGGFERLLLRNMVGYEVDVPIEAKGWAQYGVQCTATGYTDEKGKTHSAWKEGTISLEKFDALRVKSISV